MIENYFVLRHVLKKYGKYWMNELNDAIGRLAREVRVEKNYNWKVPKNCPVEIPSNITNAYSQNLYIKEHMAEKLAADSGMGAHFWIIQDWGGIRNFRKSEKNCARMREFQKGLIKGALTRKTFGVISSLSKVASFRDPEKFAIYDSRAVFALNWLMIRHTEDRRLFPQPSGRNKELKDLDLEGFLRLGKVSYQMRNYKTAFFEYCELLRKLSREALDEDTPHKLEMILFLAAPEQVAKDVRKRVKVKLDLVD
jgi:hypothetical protein